MHLDTTVPLYRCMPYRIRLRAWKELWEAGVMRYRVWSTMGGMSAINGIGSASGMGAHLGRCFETESTVTTARKPPKNLPEPSVFYGLLYSPRTYLYMHQSIRAPIGAQLGSIRAALPSTDRSLPFRDTTNLKVSCLSFGMHLLFTSSSFPRFCDHSIS